MLCNLDTFIIRTNDGAPAVTIDVHPNGTAQLNLYIDAGSPDEPAYSGVVHGVESLLLAMAAEGVDLSDPAIGRALDTALEQLTNKLS